MLTALCLPFPCKSLQDPELWSCFEQRCARLLNVPPYPPPVAAALDAHFPNFSCSEVGAPVCNLAGLHVCECASVFQEAASLLHGLVAAQLLPTSYRNLLSMEWQQLLDRPPTVSHPQTCPDHAQLQEMLARAAEHGVAPITWQELGGQKDLVAFSHGKLLACACSCLFQEHLYCAWQELGEQQDLVAFSHGENCFST